MAMKGVEMETAVSLAVADITAEGVPNFGREMRKYFQFDDDWINLNNGSFGSCPEPVTRVYQHFQHLSERRPDTFIRTNLPRLLAESRSALAKLVNAPPATVVFVPNATTAVNIVLRGLEWAPGDKILYFDFIYGACGNTVLYVAESTAASALRVEVQLPITDDALLSVFEATITAAAGTVKLAVFDAIVSLPGVRLPFERLVAACKKHHILSLVDAAHSVGQMPLDMQALDADFFTSNCHKWLYAPRGCAFLYVPERNQSLIRSTLPTSWGFVPKTGGAVISPLPQIEGDVGWAKMFTFVGTVDSSGYLSVPAAIAVRERLGGEQKIMQYTWDIARKGAEIFRQRLGTDIMPSYGAGEVAMFNIRLPLELHEVEESLRGEVVTFLTDSLDAHGTYVAVYLYKGVFWTRVSGQVYLDEEDFVKGAEIMAGLVDMVKTGEWRSLEGKIKGLAV
ncbi:pyridoxal phosphate-dependent transferase [Tricharina praecox]|uniref:pyridoxal phosphate-dependent transferase n=1 Tax=Tricharina praecox TaxID=43433 RepID=UPI002221257A|nr:pyridoxal phosphate-dependent transferase [Tricharina praecox]KAI5850847.1 pyridoxal phosphate-dependent transferase [Tricharina praecox]